MENVLFLIYLKICNNIFAEKARRRKKLEMAGLSNFSATTEHNILFEEVNEFLSELSRELDHGQNTGGVPLEPASYPHQLWNGNYTQTDTGHQSTVKMIGGSSPNLGHPPTQIPCNTFPSRLAVLRISSKKLARYNKSVDPPLRESALAKNTLRLLFQMEDEVLEPCIPNSSDYFFSNYTSYSDLGLDSWIPKAPPCVQGLGHFDISERTTPFSYNLREVESACKESGLKGMTCLGRKSDISIKTDSEFNYDNDMMIYIAEWKSALGISNHEISNKDVQAEFASMDWV